MLDELRDAPPARLPVPILRALDPADSIEVRAAGESGMPVMTGYFSRFGNWYRVSSVYEGDFLERIARGAFAKTIAESRAQMVVLYDHGMDPSIGNKVLGAIEELAEDSRGARYAVPLFDTSYNRDLAPGLMAGVYGSSFRFAVVKDKWDNAPARSEHNPLGLPERTITEARVFEFGPVTFPANPDARAGVRSLTDRYYDFLRTTSPEQFEGALVSIRSSRTPAASAADVVVNVDGESVFRALEPQPPADEPQQHSEVVPARSIKAEALALARARALAKQETPT